MKWSEFGILKSPLEYIASISKIRTASKTWNRQQSLFSNNARRIYQTDKKIRAYSGKAASFQ
jgi:hypothetical protein